jgi:mannose-6-phosphate isomerase-like protein (cupin superfamily)
MTQTIEPTQALAQAISVFDFGTTDREKNVLRMAASDQITVLSHLWPKGGEVALHYHRTGDAAWVVIQGQVTFYSDETTPMAVLNKGEGILIPRGNKYWFESTSEEELLMARVSCNVNRDGQDDRVYLNRQS